MTPDEFNAIFDSFTSTVVRLETLPEYAVGGSEEERLQAWREGRPLPERSVRTSPWLARIATSTVAGKSWSRIRIIDDPPTWYQRYQFGAYVESQAAGEQIRIVRRADLPPRRAFPDVWVFDAQTAAACAVVMRYDEDGHWLGADYTDDAEDVENAALHVELAACRARDLNTVLADPRLAVGRG